MEKLYPVVLDLFRRMEPYGMNYLYWGSFSPALTNGILSFAEASMDNMGESTRIRKKVYFIMVESLQNITRHQESAREEEGEGFFVIQGLQNGYYITSCNSIAASSVGPLRGKLEMVNSLDSENLKNYSAEILQAGEISAKGGAGLGLIEMARRSGNKLRYHFGDAPVGMASFYFQIMVGTHSGADEAGRDENFLGARELHRLMEDQGLSIVYKGNFTQENVKGILSMIEGGLKDKAAEGQKRKMFNLIVEMLQNIYKHGDAMVHDLDNSRPGIFLIGAREKEFVLVAGSLIAGARVAALKEKIDHVNTLSPDELERFYAAKLMDEDVPGAKGAGLGLIDMRLKSGRSIGYHFSPLENDFSLLTLALRLDR